MVRVNSRDATLKMFLILLNVKYCGEYSFVALLNMYFTNFIVFKRPVWEI